MYIRIFILYFLLFFPVILLGYTNSLGKEAYNHIKNILSFKERSLQTSGHKKTQDYIKQTLEKNGLTVTPISTTVKTPLGDTIITNWQGVLSAQQPRDKETIVFMAHYDSKKFIDFNFLGADDSASGVGLLLAMAEYFSKYPLKTTTLEFVFLDAEESINLEWSQEDSLYGSKFLSELWDKEERQNQIRAIILLDMVGGAHASFCREANSDTAITNELWYLAALKGESNLFKQDCMSSVGDDHIPFVEKGFRAIDIIAFPFPTYWHTEKDTLDNISSKTLNRVGNILLEYVHRQEEIAWDN